VTFPAAPGNRTLRTGQPNRQALELNCQRSTVDASTKQTERRGTALFAHEA